MDKLQLAELCDETAKALSESNWYQGNYFENDPVISTPDELLARRNCRACAMGRMSILFFELGFELAFKRGISPFGDVESTIDETYTAVTSRDISLSNAIIEENDHADDVVDIRSFLYGIAKELRKC